jgi:phage terminase large subunit-like protein
MSPIVIRQTIKNNPELNKKYGYIHQMNNQNMLESVAQAKAIHEIANKHYDKLANEFNHNKHKIVHAWFNGVQHTKQMEKTGHDFSTQPFVKEIVEKM